MLPRRTVYDEEHQQFRESVRRFATAKIAPDFQRWEDAGIIDRSLWASAGEAGLLCAQVPEDLGGAGGDFRHNAVVIEELSYSGFAGPATDFSVHNDVCCGYLLSYGSPEQKKKWLPRMVSGETVCAIAMTEPGTGSDLQGIRTQAVREDDDFVISGQKTFISNGQMCDLVIVVARTAPEGGSRGMSLILVEADRPGFRRGETSKSSGICRPTRPIVLRRGARSRHQRPGSGWRRDGRADERTAAGTADHRAAFDRRGAEGLRSHQRLCASAQRVRIADRQFSESRFKLADLKSDLAVGWAYVDQCLREHVNRELTTYAASTAKLWITEMHGRVVDQCLQFFGGYGFMREYEICRLYADARVLRIYGGTSEIMRELISRNL